MGCGLQSPLLLGYQVKSSTVSRGVTLIDAPQTSGISIFYRCPILLGQGLTSGPSRHHQKIITQLLELETGNTEVWTCSGNWRQWRNKGIVSYTITAGTSRHSDRCCSARCTDSARAGQHWEPKSAPSPSLLGSICAPRWAFSW